MNEELKKEAEDFIIKRYKIAESYIEDNEETRTYMRMDVHYQYKEEYQLYLDATKGLQDKLANADYQLEGRDNEIKELEKENAELKELFGNCSTCKRTCDMGNCCNPRTKNGYLVDKVKVITERQKLLKENAELKADNDARKFAMAMSEKVEKQLREENAELRKKLELTDLALDNCVKELKDSEVKK